MISGRRFWVAAAGCAAGMLVFWYAAVRPASEEAEAESTRASNLAAERSGFFPADGAPIADVEKSLSAEKKNLAELSASLSQAELKPPPELEPSSGRDALYYQQKLAEFAEQFAKSGIQSGTKAPLGFPKDIAAEAVGDYLARLAVAHRFLEAARSAGVKAVTAAKHPSIRIAAGTGASELEEIPLEVALAADERSLIRLIQELTRPGRFLAVKRLKVEVKDPASGAFEATVELAGVRVRRRPAEADRAGAPAGDTSQEAPDSAAGVPVRTRKRF